jgi:hypothetical protein
MEKKQIAETLGDLIVKAKENSQSPVDQFVVAYYRVKDDSLVGYHADTFCQTVQDILEAKRYNGENPYPQLETISENFKFMLTCKDAFFQETMERIRSRYFNNGQPEDFYMDAVYLSEDVAPHRFEFKQI